MADGGVDHGFFRFRAGPLTGVPVTAPGVRLLWLARRAVEIDVDEAYLDRTALALGRGTSGTVRLSDVYDMPFDRLLETIEEFNRQVMASRRGEAADE